MARRVAKRKAARRWVTRVGGGGRVVIPAGLRSTLGLKQGDTVVFESMGPDVVLKPQTEVIRTLQDKYKKRWRDPKFSVDAFLSRRKAMWGEE